VGGVAGHCRGFSGGLGVVLFELGEFLLRGVVGARYMQWQVFGLVEFGSCV